METPSAGRSRSRRRARVSRARRSLVPSTSTTRCGSIRTSDQLGGGYRTRVRIALIAVLVTLAGATHPAGATRAADQTLVFRSAPITVAGYQVAQGELLVGSPKLDGYVTGMSADVVDAHGASVP